MFGWRLSIYTYGQRERLVVWTNLHFLARMSHCIRTMRSSGEVFLCKTFCSLIRRYSSIQSSKSTRWYGSFYLHAIFLFVVSKWHHILRSLHCPVLRLIYIQLKLRTLLLFLLRDWYSFNLYTRWIIVMQWWYLLLHK